MNVPYYLVVKFLSWLILRLGFGLTVRGQAHVPRSGPFILASNHVSYLDPLVVGVSCPRPVTFMARVTLWRHPLMRWFLRHTGVIPIQPGAGDLAAVREAVRQLREGRPVGIFPEGGRQASGQLGQAKRGVGVIATTAGVPIVPVLVQGTFQALPRGDARLHRSKIQVAFGPQITYTDARFSASQPTTKAGRAARHEALANTVTQSWRRLQDQAATGPLHA